MEQIIDFQFAMAYCQAMGWDDVWFATDIFFLITGLAANTGLLLLFLKERKSMSASTVLGLNLVAMNLFYTCTVPVGFIVTEGRNLMNPRNESVIFPFNSKSVLDRVTDTCSMFNLIGCPLLLTCMCMERYLAVVKPVQYMKMRKWEYRVAVSLVVWGVTVLFILGTLVLKNTHVILTSVPVIISCLFIVMLVCLGGIIWSLMQKSPAHATHANRRGPDSALKRQAVCNVLAVVVPAVISYLPILVIVPFEIYFSSNFITSVDICNVFELSLLFPKFGVLIGPLFYFSKAKQLCCLRKIG